MKILIVGAGLTGCVLAERLASAGREVVVVEQKEHIAGNCYDELDEYGVMVHRFGPHVFHTNAQQVVDYLSKFTDWRPYEHRVLASVRGFLVPIPINATTLSMLGTSLKPEQREVRSSEDVVMNAVGAELCNDFYRGYTLKQWGRDLRELAPSVAARIPVRTDNDDRYFTDKFQAMPTDGYTAMCHRLLHHPNIRLELCVPPVASHLGQTSDILLFTGPIDGYFRHCLGRLPYRSMKFKFEHIKRKWYQPTGSVNFPHPAIPYTRVTEFKHMTGQEHEGTTIVREYPSADGAPYYPVPTIESAALLAQYQERAAAEKGVFFAGRLGQYRYFNMDQAVAAALKLAERLTA